MVLPPIPEMPLVEQVERSEYSQLAVKLATLFSEMIIASIYECSI